MAKDKRKNRRKESSGLLFEFPQGSYYERTGRPIYALWFLLPFIVVYELGTLLLNTDVLSQSQVRVVAFVWVQDLLSHLGFGPRLAWAAPPLLVIVILLAWQAASRKPWDFSMSDMGPMVLECIALAVPLIVLSLLLNARRVPEGQGPASQACAVVQTLASDGPVFLQVSQSTGPRPVLGEIVTGIGAGIYEELFFRLILISLLMILFQDLLGVPHTNAVIVSVVISAALFSAHHHVIFMRGRLDWSGEVFQWSAFFFRTLAGVYFAGLFAARGFAVVVGTHAFYDILATILKVLWFQSNGA